MVQENAQRRVSIRGSNQQGRQVNRSPANQDAVRNSNYQTSDQ